MRTTDLKDLNLDHYTEEVDPDMRNARFKDPPFTIAQATLNKDLKETHEVQ